MRLKATIGIVGSLACYPENAAPDKITKAEIILTVKKGNKDVHSAKLVTEDKATIHTIIGMQPPDARASTDHWFRNGPYAVQILVNGVPRPGQMVDGMPFVRLARNDIYTIRLRNDSPGEAAAWVGIDGLSMYAFNHNTVQLTVTKT